MILQKQSMKKKLYENEVSAKANNNNGIEIQHTHQKEKRARLKMVNCVMVKNPHFTAVRFLSDDQAFNSWSANGKQHERSIHSYIMGSNENNE